MTLSPRSGDEGGQRKRRTSHLPSPTGWKGENVSTEICQEFKTKELFQPNKPLNFPGAKDGLLHCSGGDIQNHRVKNRFTHLRLRGACCHSSSVWSLKVPLNWDSPDLVFLFFSFLSVFHLWFSCIHTPYQDYSSPSSHPTGPGSLRFLILGGCYFVVVSYSPGWSWTSYIAKYDLRFLILLLVPQVLGSQVYLSVFLNLGLRLWIFIFKNKSLSFSIKI